MKSMTIRPVISTAVLAASLACLFSGAANAQSTYRSDREGRPIPQNGDDNGRLDSRQVNGRLMTRTQRVRAGDTVTLFYTVINDSRNPQTFRFPSSLMFDMEANRVDVRAEDRRGNGSRRPDRWRYSDGQFGAQVLSEFTLRPGQSRSFVGRWQTDRNQSAGTYEVTSFLTPQRNNRAATATTRVIIENDRGYDGNGNGNGNGNGGGRDDHGGRGNGNGSGGGWDNRQEENGTLEVRDLLRSDRYVGHRVTVRGIYRSNGSGNNSWLLDGGSNQTLIVIGNLPKNGSVNDRVSVTGTLHRSRTGRYTLENN